jgi:type I restriction enzyme S subunit
MALAKGLMVGLTRRTVAFNQDVKALVPNGQVLSRYLLFSIWGHDSQLRDLIDEASHGTKRLSTGPLQDFRIPLPPIAEQEAITSVLGALDDKIGSNERAARAAEEVAAQAVANVARVLDYNGCAPTGWVTTPFSDAVEVSPRVRISKGTDTPFVEMAAVDPFSTRPRTISRRPYSGGSKFERGDVLFARITGCIEHGKGALVDFVDESSAGSTEFLVFRSKSPLSPEIVFALSRNERLRNHAIANMVGTSGRQRVDNACWRHLLIGIAPPSEVRDAAVDMARTLFAKSHSLWLESRTLTELRDMLLPKLVSGQIRVPQSRDPDEMIGSATEVHAEVVA